MDFCGTRTCDLQLGYIVNCYISVLGLYNIPLLLAGVSCLVPSYFFTVLSSHTRPRAVEPSLTLFYLDITHVRGKKQNKIRFHSGARESGNKDKKVLYECTRIFDSHIRNTIFLHIFSASLCSKRCMTEPSVGTNFH